jgi:predicted Zn-dependent peptidase
MHHRFALENGLGVVVTPQPQLHRAHVALYVRVGSRFERSQTNGISHFLEHMIYRGTDRLPSAHQVNSAFEQHGGYLYAATFADFGVFSVTLPPETLDDTTALFGEVLRSPAFLDIDVERGIVCEEILEDLDDEGRQVNADNLARTVVYPSHPLGFTITGDQERVNGFTVEGLRAHHDQHYTAENAVLAFSGPVDVAQAKRLAEAWFANLPIGERIVATPPVHAQKKPRLKIVENVSSQTDLRVCLRAFGENETRRPVLDMLMRVIDDGMSTRLYHRICDAKGLCYDVSAGYDGYEDDGLIDFAAGVQHQRTARVAREILELMVELAEHGPTEQELEKARRRHGWEMRALADSAEDLAGFYAGGMLFQRFQTPEERHAALSAVTVREVRDMARLVARPDRLNVIAVGLLDDGEDARLTETVKGWKGV